MSRPRPQTVAPPTISTEQKDIPPEHWIATEITLPAEAFAALCNLVEHPPGPSPALRALFTAARPYVRHNPAPERTESWDPVVGGR